MKILFDHQAFTIQDYGGISRYFCELIQALDKRRTTSVKLSLRFSNNDNLPEIMNLNVSPFCRNYKFKGKTKLMSLLNNIYFRKLLLKHQFDVFHPTYYDPYFLKLIGNSPFVITVYDMIHELFREAFPLHDKTSCNKQLLVKKATKVITISENTKNDLVRLYGIDRNNIFVTYLASDLKPPKALENTLKLPNNYILFIGNRSLYKNFSLFLKSITTILKSKRRDICLICGGGGKFTKEELNTFVALGLNNKVFYCPINTITQSVLYSKAVAFVFPSLYEGFGIPILEAFSCGCPAILSNTSCMPEIAEDGAKYFDPTNKDSMLDSITQVIDNISLREHLIRRGYKRLKNFSWDKTADKTNSIYSEITT